MKCEFCAGETVRKRVRKQHWYNGRLYIVDNLEAEICSECGERYYHATTLDALDRTIAAAHAVKETLAVEVLSV